MGGDEDLPTGTGLKNDEELTSTVEEQIAGDTAGENTGEDQQTQPLRAEDLREAGVEPHSPEELQEENAGTSLDQPSDSTS